jgi:two-component system C4-dicarboxylate transport response regulator DctD
MDGVIVTDMRLPGADGLSLIAEAHDIDPDLPVIMITGHGDVNLAVQAMRTGAYDFIPKPFSPEQLVEVVGRALDKRRLTLEVANLRRALTLSEGLEGKLVGHAPAIARVRQLITEIADSPVDVLIRGETGTGKEVVARALHDQSSRRNAPYVALNCGGLPDSLLDSELFGHEPGAFTGAQKRRIGRIEHANGGTLFLDELESMPMGVQVKLLRVLQERCIERLGSNQSLPVDVRVVAATNVDLEAAVAAGRFRRDLMYRLNVYPIAIPSLRERAEDIEPLANHMLRHFMALHNKRVAGITDRALDAMRNHAWPGNVRELENLVERGLIITPPGQMVDVEDLFAVAPASPQVTLSQSGELRQGGAADIASLFDELQKRGLSLDALEDGLIQQAVERAGGNLSAAARTLGLTRPQLSYRLQRIKDR